MLIPTIILSNMAQNIIDPLKRLGTDLFLETIHWHDSIQDITNAEAVHPSWRAIIRAHDRSIWLPVAQSLGIQAKVSSKMDGSAVRKVCETFSRRERNWRSGDCRSDPLVTGEALRVTPHQRRTGVWRIKIDEHARVLYTTMRDQHMLCAIDLDTSEIVWVLEGVEPHAHIEFEDGYAVITEHRGLIIMKTKRILDKEQANSLTTQGADQDVIRGELVEFMAVEAPDDAAALRMRPRPGKGPELCSASISEAFIWDVSNGSKTCHIAFVDDYVNEHLSYLEFDEQYVFVGLSRSVDIYDRRDSKRIAKIPTASAYGASPPVRLGVTVSKSPNEGPPQCTFPISLDHPTRAADLLSLHISPTDRNTKVHYTGTDLVVATDAGLGIVVTDYAEMLAKVASEDNTVVGASVSLLEQGGVYVVRSNSIWEHLDVQGDYAILQSMHGVFLLPLRPFHTGAAERGEGVLHRLNGDHTSAWTGKLRAISQDAMAEQHGPSCVQSTADAIYYVHPFGWERRCLFDFDVNVLSFVP